MQGIKGGINQKCLLPVWFKRVSMMPDSYNFLGGKFMDELGNVSKKALKANELDMAKVHCGVNKWLSKKALFRQVGTIFPLIYNKVGHVQ